MSQLTHPITTFRSDRIVVSAALLALAATAAVVLVLALGRSSSESNDTPVTPNTSPPDVRYDGGPEEGRSFSTQQPGVRYDGGPEERPLGRVDFGPLGRPRSERGHSARGDAGHPAGASRSDPRLRDRAE